MISRIVGIFATALLVAGCMGDDTGTTAPPATTTSSPPIQPTTSQFYFNGTLAAGAFRAGDFSQVQRETQSFVVDNGTKGIVAILTFTAQAGAGDIDFHFERPVAQGEDALFGQDQGHDGSAASPVGGTITVGPADATPGNWTIVVHTCEEEPACANAEAQFRVAVEVTRA